MPFTGYTQRLGGIIDPYQPLNPDHALNRGLVVDGTLTGHILSGSTVYDASVNGRDWTLQNGGEYTAEFIRPGGFLSIFVDDAGDEYWEIPLASLPVVSTFTMQVYVRFGSLGTIRNIFRMKPGGGAGSSAGFSLEINDDEVNSGSSFLSDDSGNNTDFGTSGLGLVTNTWYRFVMRHDQNRAQVFVDRTVEVDQDSSSITDTITPEQSMRIGAFGTEPTTSRHLEAWTDAARYWDRALSNDELDWLWEEDHRLDSERYNWTKEGVYTSIAAILGQQQLNWTHGHYRRAG